MMTLTQYALPPNLILSDLPSVTIAHRGDLPSCPAIYFVFTEQDRLLYVGKSGNLHTRWVAHHRQMQFDGMAVRIAWLAMEAGIPDSNLQALERSCILQFQPMINGTRIDSTEPIPMVLEVRLHITNTELIGRIASTMISQGVTAEACILTALDHVIACKASTTNYNKLVQKIQGEAGVLEDAARRLRASVYP